MERKLFVSALIVGSAWIAVGCGPDPTTSAAAGGDGGTAQASKPFIPDAEAGIKIQAADPTAMIAEAKKMSFAISSDPFALRSYEVSFDRSQLAANLNEQTGFYPMIADEKVETVETITVEPQPARRLAGILIGETVTALIDMGDGKGLQQIHPGMVIGPAGNEWIVVSIDEEKAILRRKDERRRPQTVVVRLLPDDGSASVNGSGQSGGGGTSGPPTTDGGKDGQSRGSEN